VKSCYLFYQVVGFEKVPLASFNTGGNWDAARTFLFIVRMYEVAALRRSPLIQQALTIICDGYIISDKTEDGRSSAHYELIWEIPARAVRRNEQRNRKPNN
jgi:hypothetical protein